MNIIAYLADQNPGSDRSYGISRMSYIVLEALHKHGGLTIRTVTAKGSQQPPDGVETMYSFPWSTTGRLSRLLTDHVHPLFVGKKPQADIFYYPKGYLPFIRPPAAASVVTVHDTIIQYYADHYPAWRHSFEYSYWAMMLRHTVSSADCILTVSESSRRQIHEFMDRHGIRRKAITVTYEPCFYENIPQPQQPAKENYVVHLASCEPHKRTAHLIRWWHEAECQGRAMPMLHLIGNIPPEVLPLLASSRSIVKRPFLEDVALQDAYLKAQALILPSEIEGFGLPALEAYYLGTPVCYVGSTSVEEVLRVATDKGSFTLDSAPSLFAALEDVTRMTPAEVRECGLKLRAAYDSQKVARRMIEVFEQVRSR